MKCRHLHGMEQQRWEADSGHEFVMLYIFIFVFLYFNLPLSEKPVKVCPLKVIKFYDLGK